MHEPMSLGTEEPSTSKRPRRLFETGSGSKGHPMESGSKRLSMTNRRDLAELLEGPAGRMSTGGKDPHPAYIPEQAEARVDDPHPAYIPEQAEARIDDPHPAYIPEQAEARIDHPHPAYIPEQAEARVDDPQGFRLPAVG
ncbi:MAG: hypothetical protein WDW36_008976 [Sanguina aurantia]